MDENTLEFDMVGIDAAIANAFRRILLAEVCHNSLTISVIQEHVLYIVHHQTVNTVHSSAKWLEDAGFFF